MESGLRDRRYALLAKGLKGASVEVHGDQGGNALSAAGQHGHFVEVAGSVDGFGERVTHVGDALLVLNLRRGHVRSVPHIYGVLHVHQRYHVLMTQGLPEDLATSMSSTLQHIRLIQAKEARLAAARDDALAQVLHRIASDYRTGRITQHQLCIAVLEIRGLEMSGRMRAWDEIVGVSWKRLTQIAKHLPNGPEGSWVGEYPMPADASRPIYGTPVVYVLFDEANEPCYVGSTDKFSARMTAHEKNGKRFVRWQAHQCDDREHAYRLEDRLLKRHKPYLNQKAGR